MYKRQNQIAKAVTICLLGCVSLTVQAQDRTHGLAFEVALGGISVQYPLPASALVPVSLPSFSEKNAKAAQSVVPQSAIASVPVKKKMDEGRENAGSGSRVPLKGKNVQPIEEIQSSQMIENVGALSQVLPVVVRDHQNVGATRQRAEALLESGIALAKDQQVRGAIEVLQKAWLMDPSYTPARDALVALYVMRQDYASAWSVLLKNAGDSELSADLWIQRAYVAEQLGGDAKALEVLEQAPGVVARLEQVGLYKFSLYIRMQLLEQALNLTTLQTQMNDNVSAPWIKAHLSALILSEKFEQAYGFFMAQRDKLHLPERLENVVERLLRQSTQ